ncbi:MAG TPA: Lrp/AsnC family transcriptional regulator [Victivallales bacterium]|nr:Lrp/AsnC family transcriptional regulator [Victivallales bacterium]HPO90165.1 Lrp/AsnC family transcriptional regulator [Victivallales bacterium]HRR28819.1 Lrp/AsnC family transcriptional regulator [Victivallales bacterium]
MKNAVLKCLIENARMDYSEISERTGLTVDEIRSEIEKLEKNGVIKGYHAIIDDSVENGNTKVCAIIEVKVRPEREGGFDKVARRISKFPEVVSVNLVSGSFDLELEIQGDNLHEVANFVASKLAPIDGVLSTNTCFLLKRYKIAGKILDNKEEYERLKVTP